MRRFCGIGSLNYTGKAKRTPKSESNRLRFRGQGWWGETNDKDITSVMFITIAFFPLLILVLSLIQWRLDKRHHARDDAANARAANADWRGGW